MSTAAKKPVTGKEKPAKTMLVSSPPPAIVLILLFTAISAVAWRIMWWPMTHPSPLATLTLRNYCPEGAPPSKFLFFPALLGSWTTIVNDTLCLLTTCFELILRSPWRDISAGTVAGGGGREMAWQLLTTVLPPLGLMYLEAERPSASIWVKYPVVWGFAYQNLGAGIVCPLYFLLLLVTSKPQAAAPSHRGEAAFVGIILGYILPTVAMFLLEDYRWTTAWQFFPIFIGVFRDGWALIRPPAPGEDAGLGDFWARMTQGLGVIIGTSVHILALCEAAELDMGYSRMWTAYARTFLPVLPVPSPTVDAEGYLWHTVANFLKWDWIFIFGTTYVAALLAISQTRTARARTELSQIFTWFLSLGVFILMGPAALLAGTWMWRDDILWEEREGKTV
ncbi:hypothetical protein CALVIDRAFT_540996 [Calocera viscosa TUFC12733]|uniref:Uncharacterized protein n=1 Tax=Calocera viscosa (strain TUFC12733) TaxID=1330018 RepID=A0A167I706_CALVF|nr:hypothetical protein CALVIDRAFT_540996 [Calocera viscosa TUFC12733]